MLIFCRDAMKLVSSYKARATSREAMERWVAHLIAVPATRVRFPPRSKATCNGFFSLSAGCRKKTSSQNLLGNFLKPEICFVQFFSGPEFSRSRPESLRTSGREKKWKFGGEKKWRDRFRKPPKVSVVELFSFLIGFEVGTLCLRNQTVIHRAAFTITKDENL